MATFKAAVKYQRADGFYQVYIRVTHHTKIAYMRTDKMVDKKGITKDKGVKDPFVLQYCTNKIAEYIDMLNKKDIRTWTVKDVVAYLESGTADICFSDYARKYHDDLYNNGQQRNARNYELAYQHLERYAGTNKVMFSHLTSGFINGWIKTLGNTSRAKEMYPVCIRQVFKQALVDFNDYDAGQIRITTNPWPKVKIPKADKPEKKAITLEQCRAFFAAPLPESDRKYPLPELGRDVALLVLCLAGINTVDLFNLKKKDYHDGIIGYERAKTRKARADNAYIEMRVPAFLQPTFDKYLDTTESDYLLNFHRRLSTSDSFNANVNIGIRQICEKSLGMAHEDAYSVYTFRHTWATVAQNDCGASESEVGFALNHSQNKVTRGYIKVDFSPAWTLNEQVIEKIFFTEDKSSRENREAHGNGFGRFSYKQLMRGTLYYRGKVLSKIEDVGFNNVDEIIGRLMADLPEDVPNRSMVNIRIDNVDKGQTQYYERQVRR